MARIISRMMNIESRLTHLSHASCIAVYNNISKLIDVVIYRQRVSIYIVAAFTSHIRV